MKLPLCPSSPSNLPGDVEAQFRPVTLAFDRARGIGEEVRFGGISFEALTPWIACSMTASEYDETLTATFVLYLPLEGAPEDRHDRIVRSLIGTRDQLLRYILFLLAAGDEVALSSAHVQELIRDGTNNRQAASSGNSPLLEAMLRTLHRTPEQLERVEALLQTLRRDAPGAALLTPEFQAVWEPIWEAARRTGERIG
jgi:hypothetical protein